MCNHTHPIRLFRETIFQPLVGAVPPNFRAPQNDQVLLAHSPLGSGSPLQFFKRGSKIGLNFSILATRFFEPGGVVL